MNWVETLLVAVPWVTGGLAGAVFTLGARIVSERRRKKRISLDTEKTRYTLPPLAESAESSHHELKVAYNGITYEHLFSYSAVAKNVGYGSVTPYSLVFVMPKDANVLATFSYIEPVSNEIMVEKKQNANNLEYIFKFPRLEKGDTAAINLLVDCTDSQVRCILRDADDVEFVTSPQRESSEHWFVHGLILLWGIFAAGGVTWHTINARLHNNKIGWDITDVGPIFMWLLLLIYIFLWFLVWKSGRSRPYVA
jgi:hypothetical protein